MATPESYTRANLIHLLEADNLANLFQHLQIVTSANTPNEVQLDEVILLSGRYQTFLNECEQGNQSDEDLQLEYRKIKYALLNLIKNLSLPEGKLSLGQRRRKTLQGYWQSLTRSNWQWSLFSALLALLLLGLGQFQISIANITLHLRVSQLGLRTTEEWKIGQGQDLVLNRFEADLLRNISFLSPAEANSVAPFSLIVEGNCHLDELFIPAQQTLTLSADYGNLLIRLASTPINGNLYVQQTQVEIPELNYGNIVGMEKEGMQIDFQSDFAPSFLLDASENKPIDLPLASIDSLGLQRISFDQDSSTIKSGFIQMEGIETALSLGDRLSFSGFEKTQLRLLRCDRDLEIELKGKVRAVHLNQRGNAYSLMPTWLRYLQLNQTIAFYAGIFVAIFAFLFPLRKEFFQKVK